MNQSTTSVEESDEVFDAIEWDETSTGRPLLGVRTGVFLIAVGLLVGAFLYDYFYIPANEPTVAEWNISGLDWLFILSILIMFFYLIVPLALNPRLTRHYWRQLRTNKLAVASLIYLILFFILGTVGPIFLGQPQLRPTAIREPPLGFSTPALGSCIGPVVDGHCHGTLKYPLGTTIGGQSVLTYSIAGMRVALEVSLITAMLLVPLATAIGTVAAYFGGWVDELLMRYIDIQQVIPPFFVYIVAQFVYGPSLLLMIGIFGLLSWGGTARLVRSEALQKTESEYVMAAKSAGVSRFQIIRKHIVPNSSNTVITAVTLQMPTLIVIEATLSFLKLGSPGEFSWGNIIATGMNEFPTYWWIATFPALFIAITIVSFNLLGDALRDVFDPRLRV
ncbi:MAG: ABC transporter permease [Halobacteria archaeon]|nr:ABC transporter permease [Halobacteria archaeon]